MAEHEALRVPEAYRALCELCQEPLDTRHHGDYQWVAGWAPLRAKGANAVADATRYRRYAHGECVRRSVAGKIEQGTLF